MNTQAGRTSGVCRPNIQVNMRKQILSTTKLVLLSSDNEEHAFLFVCLFVILFYFIFFAWRGGGVITFDSIHVH